MRARTAQPHALRCLPACLPAECAHAWRCTAACPHAATHAAHGVRAQGTAKPAMPPTAKGPKGTAQLVCGPFTVDCAEGSVPPGGKVEVPMTFKAEGAHAYWCGTARPAWCLLRCCLLALDRLGCASRVPAASLHCMEGRVRHAAPPWVMR